MTPTPRFELHHRRSRLTRKPYWFWTLIATNGETIATSERYTSEAAARNGIAAVGELASGAPVVTTEG